MSILLLYSLASPSPYVRLEGIETASGFLLYYDPKTLYYNCYLKARR